MKNITLDNEELAVLIFSLEQTIKNCIEPNGVGSYGGEVAQRILGKATTDSEYYDWVWSNT